MTPPLYARPTGGRCASSWPSSTQRSHPQAEHRLGATVSLLPSGRPPPGSRPAPPGVDGHHVRDRSATVRAGLNTASADLSLVTETVKHAAVKHITRWYVQVAVNRFVRDPHRRITRMNSAQPLRDLPGRSVHDQHLPDHAPQQRGFCAARRLRVFCKILAKPPRHRRLHKPHCGLHHTVYSLGDRSQQPSLSGRAAGAGRPPATQGSGDHGSDPDRRRPQPAGAESRLA
jgi:hypothetical protein